MKHLLSYVLLAFIIPSMIGCDKKDPNCPPDDHISVLVSNQSTRTINFIFYWDYPDTAIGEYNPKNDGTDGLSPGEEFNRSAGRHSCWESILRNGNKEWIHFFDQDSLQTIPWDTIRATQRGLLERRLIDLEYLKANDFKIIYQ